MEVWGAERGCSFLLVVTRDEIVGGVDYLDCRGNWMALTSVLFWIEIVVRFSRVDFRCMLL